jgi:hypothetical protein
MSLQWALPTFIIPKKDSTVHTISGFRELNKRIVRKPYPMLEPSRTGTYIGYPYQEFHVSRALFLLLAL